METAPKLWKYMFIAYRNMKLVFIAAGSGLGECMTVLRCIPISVFAMHVPVRPTSMLFLPPILSVSGPFIRNASA